MVVPGCIHTRQGPTGIGSMMAEPMDYRLVRYRPDREPATEGPASEC